MVGETRTARKLADLRKMLEGKAAMLIGLQDNPDPDAFGAAAALRKLANDLAGVHCSLACGGTVGRSENRAMVRYLGLNLHPMAQVDWGRYDVVALVDTQPGQGNNSVPGWIGPDIIIDHHPTRRESRRVPLTDIRSHYGATCTILTEYLRQAQMTPEPALATALLYGIRSDTQDFGRETTQADIEAHRWLYDLANKRMLGVIQRGEVPSEYFRLLAAALNSAHLCGRSVYCDLGEVDNPDMIAEVADLLLRHEDAEWSACWGVHDGRILLSVRTITTDGDADLVVRKIVSRKGTGGGHHTMAGGQIPLPNTDGRGRQALSRLIRDRFLRVTGNDQAPCTKLI